MGQLFFNGLADSAKNLSYVRVIFRTAFDEGNSIFASKCIALGEGYLPFGIFAIDFIAYDDFAHGLRLGLVDLFDPILHIIKGLPIGNRIDEDDPRCTFIVCFRDSLESLLAGGIPNLHFDFDAFYIDRFYFEVYPNSGDVRHFVLLVNVAE